MSPLLADVSIVSAASRRAELTAGAVARAVATES
jgi:hypothetical protein